MNLAPIVSLALLTQTVPGAPQSWSVLSPNGQVNLRIQSQAHALTFQVEHGPEGARALVLGNSPMGLMLEGQDFVHGLRLVSAEPQKLIQESYTMLHGKRRSCLNQGNQLTLTFRNAKGRPLHIDLRAYNDGVAFRYRLAAGASSVQRLKSEATGFALPADARLWCAPSDKAGTYAPAYETYYENEMAVGTPAPLGVGWSFPLLFRTGDRGHWGLITEANVDAHFCGCRLSSTASNGVYMVALPNQAEGNSQGSPMPSSSLPWEMPWRVIILGSSPGAVVESTLVTDISASSRVQDTGWIRPGRVAWSWWSDNPSPKDAAKQRHFIDLAAEMGWEYVLVDANWTIMETGNIHDVLRYAKEKGVGILLWYNSGGPHNVVTEKPRDCFTYQPVRNFEFELLKSWGVKGVKVDFFQSDKQEVIGLYQAIMHDAADKQIMVNFHGCTLPRGWERTWPNLMSMEAVRGEECYIFDSQYPERAPVQNTILPFTRNAVGPMDYTPAGLTDNRYPHLTSYAHELALTVVFESGWLHLADKPEAYLSLAPIPKQFLKEVPVAWDETRLVDGYPGRFVIVARRKNQIWYIGGINGENTARQAEIQPGRTLNAQGPYELTTIADGQEPRSLDSAEGLLGADQGFTMKMLPRGGFIAVLKPQKQRR